jgi:surfeit locus 1 family protein
MIRSLAFAVVLGLAGVGVLVSLGIWQLQRLEWKLGIITDAEANMVAPPVALPASLDPVADRYRAVTLKGRFTGEEAHVLTSTREKGPGFLVIAAFEVEGRRILVDRGFVPETEKTANRPSKEAEVIGNLNWPDDMTSSIPPYDADRAIWYGRDVDGIAALLGTEPALVIARSETGDGVIVQPVTTAGFRNDHLNYAITWFSLAAVWAGMTAYLLWRIRARTV